jgi:prepilin-type N-terminal cleavage/methylation domain-containing protein
MTGRRSSDARGFTLFEVIVALTITSLLLLGARAIFEQLADGAEQVVRAAAAGDAQANGDRLLRDLVERIEVEPGDTTGVGAHAFMGEAGGARFWTWCDVPAGWQERCHVTLGLLAERSDTVLVVAIDGGEVLPIRRHLYRGNLAYLLDAGNGGQWSRRWESVITPPLAIGVLSPADTLLLRIGDRG